MAPQLSHSIDEDLISAYVDGDVTAEERRRVEAAMAANEQVAWEVNTLRQTVELLQDMPRVALPRSFVLTEDQVAEVVQARRSPARAPSAAAVEAPAESRSWTSRDRSALRIFDSFKQALLGFLKGGNPLFRNAAALAAVLLLLVVLAEIPLQRSQFSSLSGESGDARSVNSAPRTQVTVVGGSFSQAAGGDVDEPAAENRVAADEDLAAVMGDAAEQESGEAASDFGVMSTDGADAESVEARSRAAAARPVEVERSIAAAAEPDASLSTSDANAPAAPGGESAGGSQSALQTGFRYARAILAAAIVLFLLLSRIRPRERRA